MVSFSDQILPGGEGKIEIKFNTLGYAGKRVEKITHVTTNDPENSNLTIYLTGYIDHFVFIDPYRAVLVGALDDALKSSVTIKSTEIEPFKILSSRTKDGKYFKYELEEIKNDKISEFKLTVENIAKSKVRYNDSIYFKTDNAIHPEIEVEVYGDIFSYDDLLEK
ncbi:MAG: hypothetical protein HQK76_11645 [Desulfobacterales bacterium]|nr:hypothetical protein [Desulfobacterales bacterium]